MSLPFELSGAIPRASSPLVFGRFAHSRVGFQRVSLLHPRWGNCGVLAALVSFWAVAAMAVFN
jgi:hypothetical protein